MALKPKLGRDTMKKSLFTSQETENSNYYLPPTWQHHEEVIRHLSQLSQNVLLVIAPQDGGKTTFMQHMLDKRTPALHKMHLTAKAHTSVEAMLNQVVQSFGLDWHGVQQTRDDIHHLQFQGQSQHLGIWTLFVDDAHLLSNEQLQALVELINFEAQSINQMRLVLLGEPSLELRMFSPDFTAISNNRIYTIELESWTLQDVQTFVNATSVGQLFNKDQVLSIFERSNGLPGAVVREKLSALEQQGSNGKRKTKKSFNILGLNPISLGVLAGLALGGTYLVVNNANTQEEASPTPVNAAQTAEQNWPSQNASPKQSSPSVAFHFDKVDNSDVIEDDMKENHEEQPQVLTVAPAPTTKENQAHTEPAVQQAPQQAVKQTAQEITQQTPVQTKESDSAQANKQNEVQNAKAVKVTEKPQKVVAPAQPKQKQSAKKGLSEQENHLLSVNKRHYTLQLLGASNEESIKKFVKKHGLEKTTYAFQTKRQGKDWYIVVYGDYSTNQEAKLASEKMTKQLNSSNIQPWVRDLNAIHKDIELKG